MGDEATDEELMAAYVAGDERAFTQLFARLAPAVHRFFMRSFRSAATGDDLLQTTFLKLHKARKDFRRGMPLKPWLFTIAARVRLDELRRRYGGREDAGEEVLAKAIDAVQTRELAMSQAPSDVTERVRDALDRLPEGQRVVVHLHRYEGLTFGEIAQALGSTEGAIKLRAFRAYEQLRKELEDVLGKSEAGRKRAEHPPAGGDLK